MKNIFSSSKPEPVPALASIVAYKLDDKLVYVPLALTFEDAINLALQNFPELIDISRSRITFTVGVKISGEKTKARISREVYKEFLPRFHMHEIMYITILDHSLPPSPLPGCPSLPSPTLLVTDTDAPPMYDTDEKRRVEFLNVDTKSRPSTPQSEGRSRSRSPSSTTVTSRAIDWIENKVKH